MRRDARALPERDEIADGPTPAELGGRADDALAQVVIGQGVAGKGLQQVGDLTRRTAGREQVAEPIPHRVGNAADTAGQDRHAKAQTFETGDAAGFRRGEETAEVERAHQLHEALRIVRLVDEARRFQQGMRGQIRR